MAEPNPVEHVERAEYGHELNKIKYDATSTAPVDGWASLDENAGEIDKNGIGHGHFSEAEHGAGGPGPWKQT